MVRVAGFEPATPCTQNKCATRLRHTRSIFLFWVDQLCLFDFRRMGAVSVKAVSHFVHHDFLSVTSYLYSFSSGKSTVFLVVSQFEIERNAKDARRDATSRVCGGKRYVRLRQSQKDPVL